MAHKIFENSESYLFVSIIKLKMLSKTEKEVIHQLWELHKLEDEDEIKGFMKGYEDVEEELKDFKSESVVTPAHLSKVLNDISIAVNEYPGINNEWRVRLLGKIMGGYFLLLRYLHLLLRLEFLYPL